MSREKPRKSSLSRKLALVAISSFLSLGFMVLGFELLSDNRMELYPEFVTAADSQTILNRPHLDRMVRAFRVRKAGLEPFRYQVNTDEHGCRTGNTGPDSPARTLAMVGDSFSFGSHAKFEETIQGRLANGLPQDQVLNFSVPGSCSRSYPKMLSAYLELKQSKVDKVVVGLYVDETLGDVPRRRAREKYGPYRVLDGYSVSPATYQQAQGSLGQALFRAKVLGRRWSSLYNRLSPSSNEQFALAAPQPSPTDQEGILASLSEICEVAGLPPEAVVVHFIPSANEVVRRASAGETEVPPSANELFWSELKVALEERGHPVSDPREAVVQELLQSKVYPFTADSHLNGDGFAVVTKTLLELL